MTIYKQQSILDLIKKTQDQEINYLDLGRFDINENDLPEELFELEHLNTLDLSNNYLKELPKKIGRLKNLVLWRLNKWYIHRGNLVF